jgi:hypothetical protein
MDETGILLSFLASQKYVIHKDDLKKMQKSCCQAHSGDGG